MQTQFYTGSATPFSILQERDHSGADRHALHCAQHVQVEVPTRAGHGVAAVPPVAIHGPGRLLKEPASATTAVVVCNSSGDRHFLALECDAHEARGHLLDERGGGHC